MKLPYILSIALLNSVTMTKILSLHQGANNYLLSNGYSVTTSFLLMVFFATYFIGRQSTMYPKKHCLTKQTLSGLNVSPKTTAFVFDLHGVVFKFNPLGAIWQGLKTDHKKELFFAAINPFLIWDVFQLVRNSSVVEEAIMTMGQKYPSLKPLIPTALNMANEQLPIKPTVKILEQIKQQGFKIFVFSNIGEHSALILKSKYPDIFNLFDGVLVTSATDNYVMKPDAAAFRKFLNKFKFQEEQIIFIDDKQSNIHAAQQLGIPAVLFTTPKECRQQLEQILPLHG